jgi:hypothetical protein
MTSFPKFDDKDSSLKKSFDSFRCNQIDVTTPISQEKSKHTPQKMETKGARHESKQKNEIKQKS